MLIFLLIGFPQLPHIFHIKLRWKVDPDRFCLSIVTLMAHALMYAFNNALGYFKMLLLSFLAHPSLILNRHSTVGFERSCYSDQSVFGGTGYRLETFCTKFHLFTILLMNKIFCLNRSTSH